LKQINGYVLSDETLKEWKERFVPEYDILFFISRPDFLDTKKLTADTLRSFSLDEKTSFATWAISSEAKHYTIMSNDAFLELTAKQKEHIIKEQWKLGRGMVLSEDDLITLLPKERKEALEILERSSYKDNDQNTKVYLIQKFLWDSLSAETQTQFLVNYAAMWIDETALFVQLSEHSQKQFSGEYQTLASFFDTFPSRNGPNCLAAAAAAFTQDIGFIEEWMHPERFSELLEDNRYIRVNTEELEKLDVLVWKNQQEQAVHAAILLNNKYCFNKHGQTMYNPWQVLTVTDVIDSWSRKGFQMEIYRKK
jgi:hypothetical protein